jgi:hypothetical protein
MEELLIALPLSKPKRNRTKEFLVAVKEGTEKRHLGIFPPISRARAGERRKTAQSGSTT